MKVKFYQTNKFKELQRVWERKLAEAKFNDVEININGRRYLRQRANNSYRAQVQIMRESKQLYYNLLGQHFHEEEFTDQVHKMIMERRSNGVKIKAISGELRAMGERCHRETIRHIIRFYEVKWKIKR